MVRTKCGDGGDRFCTAAAHPGHNNVFIRRIYNIIIIKRVLYTARAGAVVTTTIIYDIRSYNNNYMGTYAYRVRCTQRTALQSGPRFNTRSESSPDLVIARGVVSAYIIERDQFRRSCGFEIMPRKNIDSCTIQSNRDRNCKMLIAGGIQK